MIAAIADRRTRVDELCRQFGVKRLEIFGSAVVDEAFDDARSDFDFIVDFLPEQNLGPWLSHYFAFRGALESLFERPVDLVMQSAMTDVHFVREANRTRHTLYER